MVDTSDPVALDCIRYCFMPLIRDDLNSILRQWNTHIISRRSNGGPSGRPDCMFYYIQSEEFQEFVEHFRLQDGFENPTDPSEALNFLPS